MHRLIFFIIALFLSLSSYAEELSESESHYRVIPRDEVHKGDFFACSTGVEVSGVLVGDAYIAGSQVIIDGIVKGDVLAIGGTVEISGEVQGNVRAIGAEVLITGKVNKNLSTCSGNVHLTTSAVIGGNAVMVSGNADIAGGIQQDLTIAGSNMRLAGHVGGMITAFAGQLRLTSQTEVGGEVSYSSTNPIFVEPGARIAGGVHQIKNGFQAMLKERWLDNILLGSRIAGFLMNLLYTFAIGLVLIKFYPHNIKNTAHYLDKKPIKALFNGVIVALVVPLISLLLLMTILGVPFALTLIAANIIGFYTAKVYVIFWASEKLFHSLNMRPHHVYVYSIGTIVYFLLLAIPYFGVLLSIVSMLMGLGAIISIQVHRRLKERHR